MPDLRIYFGGPVANLYDVGYLSTDLYQLVAFSELLDKKDDTAILRWFGEKARPFNRYATLLDKYRQSSSIREAKGGSLELVVSVASLLSSVIVPLVVMYLQDQHNQREPREISFEISVQDPRLQQILRMYGDGQFGRGVDGLARLFDELRRRGYETNLRAADAYVIHDVLHRYSQRIVKTLTRP